MTSNLKDKYVQDVCTLTGLYQLQYEPKEEVIHRNDVRGHVK
jgi:hypothetical protein